MDGSACVACTEARSIKLMAEGKAQETRLKGMRCVLI